MFSGQQKNLWIWMGILSAFFSRYTHSGKHSWESLDHLKMYIHSVFERSDVHCHVGLLEDNALIPSYFLRFIPPACLDDFVTWGYTLPSSRQLPFSRFS